MIELEFRAWDTQLKTYTYSGWGEKTFAIFAKRTNCPRYIIEQYSTQKDITGKKIFAGDIIHIESDFNDDVFDIPVIFEDGCFLAKGSGLLYMVCKMNNPVIIGHIHSKE